MKMTDTKDTFRSRGGSSLKSAEKAGGLLHKNGVKEEYSSLKFSAKLIYCIRLFFLSEIARGRYIMRRPAKLLLALAAAAIAAVPVSARKKAAAVITSAADLDGKRIGVQGGTTGETYVQEHFSRAKISSFKSGMDAALDLMNGQIDVIVLDELPARQIVSRNKKLQILDIQFAKEQYSIAVKKGNSQLLDSINAAISELKENGGYEALVSAFMGADGIIRIPPDEQLSGRPLRLGTNAAFPPFEYVEGSRIVGFDISMGQKIAGKAGRSLEIVDMSFDSLIPALSSGAIDFIAAGMSVTEERRKNVDFSQPYFTSNQVIIVRK